MRPSLQQGAVDREVLIRYQPLLLGQAHHFAQKLGGHGLSIEAVTVLREYRVIPHRVVEQHLEVVGGSSYIQMVTFTENGPLAKGLLAFSQSADPASSHHADQTRLFSKQEWPLIPYSDEQIEADLRQRLLIQE